MPSLFRPTAKPKGKPARHSRYWHIRYFCPIRRRSHVISTGCTRLKNAERRLHEFEDMLERGEVGLENPFLRRLEEQRQQELTGVQTVDYRLLAFDADLRAGRIRKRGNRKPVRPDHAATTMARIRKIIVGCAIQSLEDLSVEKVQTFLDACQRNGTIRTAQSRKHYERAIKAFSRHLWFTEVLSRDPLSRLIVTFVDEQDIVHNRGAFSTEQINAIIKTTPSEPDRAGLSGNQRGLLYAVASSTGLRARELAALRKQDIGENCECVTLSATFTKNNKPALLPLPNYLRPALSAYLATLKSDEFLWPGGWRPNERGEWVEAGWIKDRRAGEFLRADAAKAGILIGRAHKAANGGKVYDFHSFRHSFISSLERAGIPSILRGRLSRATAGIIDRYTHHDLDEVLETAKKLPVLDVSSLVT